MHDNFNKYEWILKKFGMQLHINKISDEFDIGTDSVVNNGVFALCCFITVGICVHNKFNKYDRILMKLGVQLYIIKILDEFDIGTDSIVNNGVMALCGVIALCFSITVGPCVHDNFSKFEQILMKLGMQLHISKIFDKFVNESDSFINNESYDPLLF